MSDPAHEPAIRVKGLVSRLGDQIVHDKLCLEVRRGEVLGVVGRVGSGKSLLLRTIVGLQRPLAGEIEILGQDALRIGGAAARRLWQRWGVLLQEGGLFSSKTVKDNIGLPLRAHCAMGAPLIDEIAAAMIALVGLAPDAAEKLPAQLSGGERKRAALARALVLSPEILFLDEPIAGLDPDAVASFHRLIADLRQELGLTVLLVSNNRETLYAICDRVAVLEQRKIARVIPVDRHLFEDALFQRIFGARTSDRNGAVAE